MPNLLLTVISNLLLPTASVRGGSDQSLISRARRAKFPDFPPSDVMKKMSFGSQIRDEVNPTPANEMGRQGHVKATLGKKKLPNKKVEADSGLVTLELRIPTSLEKIQDSKNGPLSVFLDTVQSEFCKAVKLSHDRLQLLGIRGEYIRIPRNESGTSVLLKNTGSSRGKSSHSNHNQFETMADQHVIVELEILPGNPGTSHATPESIFALWKAQITSSGSSLLQGPLGPVLQGAMIQRPPPIPGATMDLNHLQNAFKSSAGPRKLFSLTFMLVFCLLGAFPT